PGRTRAPQRLFPKQAPPLPGQLLRQPRAEAERGAPGEQAPLQPPGGTVTGRPRSAPSLFPYPYGGILASLRAPFTWRCRVLKSPRVASAPERKRRPEPNSLPAEMSIGVPIKVLHEAEGHIVTCETNTGEVYRGKLIEAEDNMNCQMSNITVTYRDGRVAQLEQVYIRGSKIRFLILPDMLKNAPMLKSMKNKNQGSGAGRGKAAILKAQVLGDPSALPSLSASPDPIHRSYANSKVAP
ncbi:hypothetical protein DBR06_SOUSAS910143, partial [Sousa chinensis]